MLPEEEEGVLLRQGGRRVLMSMVERGREEGVLVKKKLNVSSLLK